MMGKRIKIFIRIALICLCLNLFWAALGCGTTNTAATSTSTPLTSGESGLYETGPTNLPVTIAKLHSMNPEYVGITYLEGVFTITVAEGATEAESVWCYNEENGEEVTGTVTDGTAEIQIIATSATDSIFVAAQDPSDTDTIGIPLKLDYNGGNTIFTLTNTNRLNINTNHLSLNDKLYTSLWDADDDSSTSSFFEIDLTDTDEIKIIASAVSSGPIQRIAVQDTTSPGAIFFNNGGTFYTVTQDSSGVWGEAALASDYGITFPDRDAVTPPLEIFYAADGGEFMCQTIWYDNVTTPDDNTTGINYFKTAAVDFVSDTDYQTIDCARVYGETENIYFLLRHVDAGGDFDQPATIQRIDMANGALGLAAANPKTEYTHANNDTVRAFDVDNETGAFIAVTAQTNAGNRYIVLYNALKDTSTTIDEETITGHKYLYRVQVGTNGEVVTCNHDTYVGNTDDNYLVIYNDGTFYQLAGGADFNPCKHHFEIDAENRLFFINSDSEISDTSEDTAPNIKMMYLDDIDYTVLTAD